MPPREERRPLATEDRVLRDGKAQHEPRATAVLGDEGDAGVALGVRVHRCDVPTAELNMAPGRPPDAREHLHQLTLSVALDPRDPKDLPVAELERHALQRFDVLIG